MKQQLHKSNLNFTVPATFHLYSKNLYESFIFKIICMTFRTVKESLCEDRISVWMKSLHHVIINLTDNIFSCSRSVRNCTEKMDYLRQSTVHICGAIFSQYPRFPVDSRSSILEHTNVKRHLISSWLENLLIGIQDIPGTNPLKIKEKTYEWQSVAEQDLIRKHSWKNELLTLLLS